MGILKLEEGLIIWEIIAFVGLLLVLWRFAWGPLLGILTERETAIRETGEYPSGISEVRSGNLQCIR